MNSVKNMQADGRGAGGCDSPDATVKTPKTDSNAATEFQDFVSLVIDRALERGYLP